MIVSQSVLAWSTYCVRKARFTQKIIIIKKKKLLISTPWDAKHFDAKLEGQPYFPFGPYQIPTAYRIHN